MSTQWFCRILHEEFGPLEFSELQQLVLSGTLDRGDLVRRETEDVWAAAGKCLELRTTFGELEPAATHPTAIETSHPIRTETASAARTLRPDHVTEPEDIASQVTASADVRVPATTRQRWVAWSATAGLMLVLFFADRLTAAATPTFPQPRQVREQLAGLHWFVGTGPWSPWECRLLWLDALVVSAVASGWLTRKLTR